MAVRTSPRIWSTPAEPADLQPFRLRGGSPGCLLLHGFAGTPPEVRGLGEHLAAHGFDVLAPLLAGHGLTPEAMAQTRWRDWARSAEEAMHTLQADCGPVFVAGQSLGGTLALHLAATNPAVRGVVTMGAMGSPRFFKDWRLRVIGGLKHVVRWHVPGDDCDLGDPSALRFLHSYARRPTVCIESLLQLLRILETELPTITTPALILHGRRDRTVDVGNAPFILDQLGSVDKRLLWFEGSGHTITVDLERNQVNAAVLQWLQAH
ncbi:MAG: alpha/beta fold hydrolase [Candidatus Dormibacter sp.]